MRTIVGLALMCTHTAWPVYALGDPEPPPAHSAAPPQPHCEIAVVNPVSGYAECVEPRGVPVPPPPRRPDAPAAAADKE